MGISHVVNLNSINQWPVSSGGVYCFCCIKKILPFTYSCMPSKTKIVSFLQDQTIYISRLWVPVHERQLFPKVLHMQYHGREVHSLCFISSCFSRKNYDAWIATGCEDGTVRLTRSVSLNSHKCFIFSSAMNN